MTENGWPAIGTPLVGPKGDPGTNGTNGKDGATILSGTTSPSGGNDGDFYIDTDGPDNDLPRTSSGGS